MAIDPGGSSSDELQFDHVEGAQHADAPQAGPAVHCSGCKALLTSRYYAVNGAPVCGRCQAAVERRATEATSKRLFARAALFGLGAAVVGAAIYYGVIAITGLEIGIVAILTGYIVGRAVRQGARGHGRRRFQVLAVVLTYFSVGLAYTPVLVKDIIDHQSAKAKATHTLAAHGTRAPAADSAAPSASAGDSAAPVVLQGATHARQATPGARRKPKLLPALLIVAAMIFLLPVLVIVGSLPGGLLSALIIAIGMRQAWRMTGGRPLQITGPFRIGGTPAAGAA